MEHITLNKLLGKILITIYFDILKAKNCIREINGRDCYAVSLLKYVLETNN